jgi:hypothetical protein
MAILDPTLSYGNANLKGWFHALEGQGGDRSGAAPQGLLGGASLVLPSRCYGYPAFVFPGLAASGPVLSTLVAANAKSIYWSFKINSVTTNNGTIQLNEGVFSMLSGGGNEGVGVWLRKVAANDIRLHGGNKNGGSWQVTPYHSVVLGVWYTACLWHGGYVRLRLNRWDNYLGIPSGTTDLLTGSLWVGANALDTRSDIEIGEMLFYNAAHAETGDDVGASIFAYLNATWRDRGDAVEMARVEGSRHMWALGRVPRAPELSLKPGKRLDLLNRALGDSFRFKHSKFTHRDGIGWDASDSPEKIPEVRLSRLSLDGNRMALTVGGVERRLRDALMRAVFVPLGAANPWNNGPMVMLPPGALFCPSCPTAWASSAAPFRYLRRSVDSLVAKLYPSSDQWPLEPEGLRVDPARFNFVLNSAFSVGTLTSWTPSAGGGGLTPTAETTVAPFLFDGVTTKNAILTQDTPATRVKQISQAVSGLSDDVVVSFDHRDDVGAPLCWDYQRTSDSKYWNNATLAWNVARVYNLAPETGPTTILRFVSQRLTACGDGTIFLAQNSGGIGSRINRVYHVQVENRTNVAVPTAVAETSRMVTTAATTFRTEQRITFQGDASCPLFSWDSGTLLWIFSAPWNAVDVAAGGIANPLYLFALRLANGEYVEIYYRADTALWYAYNGTNVATCAQANAALTKDSRHVLGLRWSRGSAREGLATDSMSMVVDATEGSATIGPTFTAPLALHEIQFGRGNWPSTSAAPTIIAAYHHVVVESCPRVLSAAEILAWGRRNGV